MPQSPKTTPAPPPPTPFTPRVYMWLAVLLTLLAYLPLAGNQFVDWDDTVYIQHNPYIRSLSPDSVLWLFTHFYAGFWIPLTWLSLALDFAIGRLEPWVYHLDNLILHLLNTAVVFWLSFKLLTLFQKRTGPNNEKWPAEWVLPAAFGSALLFGTHPIHVESVAWATERKDLLSGLFSFLSLYFYLDYATSDQRRFPKYLACFAFFILALLSKPMAVSLPFVFILLDDWPLGRFPTSPTQFLREKVPFFMLALISAIVAINSQSGAGATWGLDQSPLAFRFTNSCHSLIFYLFNLLFPSNLTTFYPIQLEKTFSPEYLFSVLGVLFISAVCFIYRKKRPYLAIVWLYFLITLAPALGIIQEGNQAAGDRFTYLPSLGPSLLMAAVFVALFSRWRSTLIFLAVAWSAFLGYETIQQVEVWKNSISLWENVLRVHANNNLIVHNNLGRAYEDAGQWDKALAKYVDAGSGTTPFFYAHWGKARIDSDKGLWDDAIREYQTAIAMNPNFPPLHSGLGMVYEKKKLGQEALGEIQNALQMDPHFADAYNDLGTVYRDQLEYDKSIEALKTALSLDPDNAVYFRNLIETYQKAGQHKEALRLYRQLSENPRSLLTMSF